jgi:energy-coupling factor transporter ATP-binding protein EcfA2
MPDDWAGLFEKAELAVGACASVVDADLVRSVADTVREARLRLSYPEEVAVAALVGGTGSGKSSLLNAAAGAEIAETGGRRPTTSAPVALVPASIGEAMDGYLELLGVEEVHHEGPHDRLCLIDMPDTDSVEVGHSLQVERLLPVVDAVVWVMDPEKYRDAALHHAQLARLAGSSDRFVFVLNQVDRLDESTRETLLADLRQALAEDGIDDPSLVATAANPPAGPPIGIDELVASLSERAGSGESLRRKLISDLRGGVDRLLAVTGGSGLDFERRAATAVEEAMASLTEGDEAGAVHGLTGFLSDLAREAGEGVGDAIEEVAVRAPVQVRSVAEGGGPPLTESIIAPVRSLLARRARANALLADLALSVRAFEAAAGR